MPDVTEEIIIEILDYGSTMESSVVENDAEIVSIFGVGATEIFAVVEDGIKGDKGDKGDKGESPYDLAVEAGFSGTESEWLESLKGDKGDKGDIGNVDISNEVGNTLERKPDGFYVSPMANWSEISW